MGIGDHKIMAVFIAVGEELCQGVTGVLSVGVLVTCANPVIISWLRAHIIRLRTQSRKTSEEILIC